MSESNRPDGIDTSGSTVPPYESRRTIADVDDPDRVHRDGANVGGATGPVVDDTGAVAATDDTAGGATGSPADEQPASRMQETDLDDDRVGPAHQTGTPRAEDRD